jgi:hypothetical protein
MTVRYLIKLEPDDNHTLLVTCPDPVHKATIISRGRAGTPERQSHQRDDGSSAFAWAGHRRAGTTSV